MIRLIKRSLFSFNKKMEENLAIKRFKQDINMSSLTYEDTKDIWNNNDTLVHADIGQDSMMMYHKRINDVIQAQTGDILCDIGCGDGNIDNLFSNISLLYGIDFASNKIEMARKLNPEFKYDCQSFLDPIRVPFPINKVFSYGVMQYCKPEDIESFIRNSLNVLDASEDRYKLVAHIEVPDIDKAYLYYFVRYRITKEQFVQYKDKLKMIFSDGSYWHNMKGIKRMCQNYCEKQYGKNRVRVHLLDSDCFYRTTLLIEFI